MSANSVTIRMLAVAVVSAVALSAAPAPAVTSPPTSGEATYQNKVFKRVNTIRANHDRKRLKKDACLQRFADQQAEKMAARGVLFHQNLNKIQAQCGVGWVGENVAYGPFTPRQMVKRWMNSPGHRANILKRQFRITGVAARKAGGYWWVAQVFGRKG